MNARSEFVEPTNFSDGGEFEISRTFHAASPAFSRIRAVAESLRPGFSPTRGSGLGGDADMLSAGDAPVLPDIDDDAHAFAYIRPAMSGTINSEAAGPRAPGCRMGDSRFTIGFPVE